MSLSCGVRRSSKDCSFGRTAGAYRYLSHVPLVLSPAISDAYRFLVDSGVTFDQRLYTGFDAEIRNVKLIKNMTAIAHDSKVSRSCTLSSPRCALCCPSTQDDDVDAGIHLAVVACT